MTVKLEAPANGRRVLVIHNPVAGRRRRARFLDAIDLLERDGNELTLHLTEGPGDAIEYARRIEPGDVDLVVAAGGDGTINEVINGLVADSRPAPAPLAILPLGTSNVLAAEIGQGTAPATLARTVRDGSRVRIGLGRIVTDATASANGRRFVLMAGAGLDGHAVAAVDARLKRRFAQGAYVWAGLRAVLGLSGRRYRVEVDGSRHEAAWVVVAKASRYGGPFVLAARSRLDQPRFEVCLFDRGGIWPLMRYGLGLAFGRLDRTRGFSSVLGESVRVSALGEETAAGAEPVQCDGDDVARLPVDIDLVESALDLVVPRDGPYGRGAG